MRQLFLAALLLSTAATAQQGAAPPPAPVIPVARDVPFRGTMTLAVDLGDVTQGIFRVRQTIPTTGAGPMVLLYPQWKPGNHSPSGQIENLAGLRFTASGRPLAWRRDPVDMFAFHLDVPAGVREVVAEFQYLSPQTGGDDRRVFAPTMANLQWESVSLYPAGYYVHNVAVRASATYPAGWTGFTALRGTQQGATVSYGTVPYDILVDSPVYAGAHTRQVRLDPQVTLDLVADAPRQLAITPDQIAAHKRLVEQADRLFGARHYDHYDFLVALSDYQSGDGLEHHRSSENTLDADQLLEWDTKPYDRYVTAHEYTHSWNGKFRRPADLWTPDYRQPMRDSLLWVYEGQTQFWGDILSARSGLWSKQNYLDFLATVAARYDEGQPGIGWRNVQDTTSQPIIAEGGAGSWPSWFRTAEYYRNAELFWIEADATLRRLTNGVKGMDDFARAFFGVEPGQWDHELTYTFDDVVATLNRVAPYDWAGFLRTRLDSTDPATSRRAIEAAGYRVAWGEVPTDSSRRLLASQKSDDFTYSVGLVLTTGSGEIKDVRWDGPGFRAGLRPTETVVAVNGEKYDDDALRRAVTDAKGNRTPIRLTIKSDDRFRDVTVDYHGGLRYPRLERIGAGETSLDRLLAPR